MKLTKHKNKAILVLSSVAVIAVALMVFFSPPTGGEKSVIRVATTTSLYATGLLDAMQERFQKSYQWVEVQFIPVGSGEALRRAEIGEAHLVMVHAPSLEKSYIEKKILLRGVIFAYNYFAVVGPEEDPAGVKGSSPLEAFSKIYEAGRAGRVLFVSRGDNSGTHSRELLLWRLADLNPFGEGWYVEAGAGMAHTLTIANEKRAYTLTDIGTWLKLRQRLGNLVLLIEEDKLLLNIYSVYLINENYSGISGRTLEAAEAFLAFTVSEEGQEVVREFVPMFYPVDGRLEFLRKAWEWFGGM